MQDDRRSPLETQWRVDKQGWGMDKRSDGKLSGGDKVSKVRIEVKQDHYRKATSRKIFQGTQ